MSANELLSLISKQWASTKDIMNIGDVGYHRALLIKKDIINDLKKNNHKLTYDKVPMELVVNYFEINISYLKRVAKQEVSS